MELLRNSKVRLPVYFDFDRTLDARISGFQDKKARKLTKKRVRSIQATNYLHTNMCTVGHASALKAQTRGAQQHHPGEQEARSLSYSLVVLVDVVVVVFLQLFPLRLIGPGDFMTLCTAVTLCIFYPTLVPCYPRSSRSSRTRACEPCAACPNYTQHLRIDDMCVLERCRQ